VAKECAYFSRKASNAELRALKGASQVENEASSATIVNLTMLTIFVIEDVFGVFITLYFHYTLRSTPPPSLYVF
jgi:hypothetical protein